MAAHNDPRQEFRNATGSPQFTLARAGGATTSALTYVAPGLVALEPVDLPNMADGLVEVKTCYSAISRGTERLVFRGEVPDSEHERMRAPFQIGEFPFPVVYGYAAVGTVTDGPSTLLGRHVFALSPHQAVSRLPVDAVVPVPPGVPPRRATLAANAETALNVIWDSGIAPGDRIAIVGGGVLGLLIAGIASELPGASITVVDIDPRRAAAAAALGAVFAPPDDAGSDHDCVIHTSATEAGLATALRLAGFEASVVEASWFGAAMPRVPLGGAFHSRRLTLKSSQVGHVAPIRRARWTRRRRLEAALNLLCDARFDHVITGEVAFNDLPEALPDLLGEGAPGLATVVRYP